MENKTGKAEKILQELGKSIDDLIAKAKGSKGPIRKEFDDRIKELKRNKKTLETEFDKFRKDHSGDIDKFENSARKASDEVKKSIDHLISKIKK